MRAPGQAAISRAHKTLGLEFEVINFEFDETAGANAYADGDWVETDESPQTTSATIEFDTSETTLTSGAGADVEKEAKIYVLKDSVPLSDGTADESRATEFVDTGTGVRYRATAIEYHMHLTSIYVKEI